MLKVIRVKGDACTCHCHGKRYEVLYEVREGESDDSLLLLCYNGLLPTANLLREARALPKDAK
jgi:hypothetical protein